MKESGEVLIGPEGGEVITSRDGREAAILTAREHITITRYRLGPGEKGPPPHVHHTHTDSFYVIDGELALLLGPDRDEVSLGPGGFVAAPPKFVHTFVTRGSGARFLNFHTPDGGFAGYMRAARDGRSGVSFDTHDPPADGGLPLGEGILAEPGEGERLVSGNRVALLKGASEHLCVIEFEVNGPLGGPPVHEHAEQVDSFYVLEGELEMTVEGSKHAAGPGTLASVPPRTQHTFAHRGEGRARFLNIHAPDDGFADFMRRNVD